MGALTYLVRPKTVSCPSSVTRLGCFRFAARPSVLSEVYDLVDPRVVRYTYVRNYGTANWNYGEVVLFVQTREVHGDFEELILLQMVGDAGQDNCLMIIPQAAHQGVDPGVADGLLFSSCTCHQATARKAVYLEAHAYMIICLTPRLERNMRLLGP
ncbi:hypothetical protein OPV22_020632 [Ensete ventricosum]|uniref:Uncharacterized protein n=1 Tax=Ensete ventricosum TaxID=4639 RepID=A0AAV8QNI4_ENSVE|nr:hypothetical protein OPV22_020632 [Ensete ventricosum]